MVPQEKDLITTLLTRLKSASGQPKDADADALIRQAMVEQPDAPYYLMQTVLIQDLSLHNAQNRIAELEKQLADAQASHPSGTSFLGGLFGRNQPNQPAVAPPATAPNPGPWSRSPQVVAAPPPGYATQPQYAPQGYPQQGYPQQGYAPTPGGVFGGGGGSGFLRSAAATAAGVAGGALLFEGISSLFGHGYASGLGGFGGMGGMGTGLGETVVNNNYYGGAGDYGGGGDSAGDAGYTGGDAGSSDYGNNDFGGGGDAGNGDFGSGDFGSGDFGGGGDSGGDDFSGGDSSSC